MLDIVFNQEEAAKVYLLNTDADSELFDLAKETSNFTAKAEEIFFLPKENHESVVLAGLGDLADIDLEVLRRTAFKVAKTLKNHKIEAASLALPETNLDKEAVLAALSEGFLHSEYEFNLSKEAQEKEDKKLSIAFTDIKDEDKAADIVKQVRNIVEGIFITRDLTNTTSNILHPETLANKAKEYLEPLGVKVSVYDEKEMLDMGMEAAYAVGKGSDFKPRFILIEYYNDDSTDDITALVGKGICYDSGGYSIKSSSGMSTMQSDMGGAAAIIGAVYALAKNDVKTNVLGSITACENLISGCSYRVGDIIGSMSGKTIEVGNTDAEGRVSMADSMYYATKQDHVVEVIDIATLTGACISALGYEYTGAVTNNQDLLDRFKAASEEAGEKVWQLPVSKNFKEANKSKVADVTNLGSGGAGTVTAGLFISEFLADEKLPWLHLDIAGTSWLKSSEGYLPERATGVGVKGFYNYLAK